MLIQLDGKARELRDYFEREMPDLSVHVKQTDPDVDMDLITFFFSKQGKPAVGWDWCLKVSGQVLKDWTTSQIIRALESSQWKCRLQQMPDGGVFILTSNGLEGPAR